MKWNNLRQILFFACWLGMLSPVMAQISHLDKKISVSITNIPMKEALPKIGEIAGFQFSYNSEIIPGDSIVSVNAAGQAVGKTLDLLLGPGYRYKTLGNHVILLADNSKKRVPKSERSPDYTITGYIYDARSGGIISSASIYEVDGMFVAATDTLGFYSITIPGDRDRQVLSYSKAGYSDTLILVRPKEQSTVNITLAPRQRGPVQSQLEEKPVTALDDRKLVRALVPSKALVTAQNIEVTEQRWAQLSLFPFVGSNRFVSGLITNRLSLNVFAGYSGGVRGLEVGSFLNVVRNEMHGAQFSGFGNIVGKKSKGVQASGFFNVDLGSFSGIQASGFSNVVTDTIRGIQLAGFSNVLRGPMYGTQVSGFSNFTSQDVDGIQASGFSNVALKDVRLAQLSGFANYCRNVTGLQAAGFANIASGTNRGLQAAGFLNYAGEVKGLQLALFNIADTVAAGAPVGLLSFVVKGYHTAELTANELFPLNLTLKTGIRHFYNILTAGVGDDWLSAGYGAGTQFRLAKRLAISLDLTASYVADKRDFMQYKGGLVRLAPTIDIQLAKHLSVVFGPTINGFIGLDLQDPNSSKVPVMFSYPIHNQTSGGYPVQFWVGATAGFRL